MIPKRRAGLIIGAAIAVAVAVALLPVLHGLWGNDAPGRPLAGEVVRLETDRFVIKDKRGREFTLALSSSTVSEFTEAEPLAVGVTVQAFAVPAEPGIFVVERMRPFKVRGL